MTFYYLDASAWVKRYYQEKGTRWMQDLFLQNQMMACASLGLIEIVATLARKRKAREISPSSFRRKLRELEEDWEYFVEIQLSVEVVEVAKELTEKFALRGADAVHLASALSLRRHVEGGDDHLLFIASDHELKKAAQTSGLVIMDPEEQEILS